MSRSLKKGPYCHPKLMLKAQKAKNSGAKTSIKTWSRSSTILPDFVGLQFSVHNGRKFTDFFVTEEMVGHKLGEFARTTNFVSHGGKKAK